MRPDLVRFASTKAAPAASSGWGSWFTPQGTMNAVMTSLAMVFSFKLVGQVRFCFRSPAATAHTERRTHRGCACALGCRRISTRRRRMSCVPR